VIHNYNKMVKPELDYSGETLKIIREKLILKI
jgi:hypothetical protein